jgi:HK97 family phage portal protein
LLQSGGVLRKSPSVLWEGTTAEWGITGPHFAVELSLKWSSYSEIYRRQLWVAVLVNKRGKAVARLPLKVYERTAAGRIDARDHPYAQLLRRPNPEMSPFDFWLWVQATRDIFGEAITLKQRDRGGRPIALLPVHPTRVQAEKRDGQIFYTVSTATKTIENIPKSDVVHWKEYNPDSTLRGLSPLEPLRSTLENEDAARRATSSFWRNGARPGVALSHPGNLSQPAADRLKVQWDLLAAGADNTGNTVVLEEGMEPKVMSLSAEEAQYIETRKLNREEACAIYDIPPPVVHILDRATFTNIVEQMRSMYRDSMTPPLNSLESDLETQLRMVDFADDDVYAEFLMDEVLRGDFEQRTESYQKGINSGWLTPAEVRQKENLPPVEGSDRLLINSTLVPLAQNAVDEGAKRAGDIALLLQKIYLAVGKVITVEEARQLVTQAGGSLDSLATSEVFADLPPSPSPADGPSEQETTEARRAVMGRLGTAKSVDEVDIATIAQLGTAALPFVIEIVKAKAAGESIEQLRTRIKHAAQEVNS